MKNFTYHKYDGIEFEIMWNTITVELHEIKENLTCAEIGRASCRERV